MKYLILIFLCCLTSCTTIPEMSPLQRRQIQTQEFNKASYENVFRAFRTILQDEGYMIKNLDIGGGFILASRTSSPSHARLSPQFFFIGDIKTSNTISKSSEIYEININIEKISKDRIESRLTISRIESYSNGDRNGEEILDPAQYQNFYQKVRTEVERRNAVLGSI